MIQFHDEDIDVEINRAKPTYNGRLKTATVAKQWRFSILGLEIMANPDRIARPLSMQRWCCLVAKRHPY
ncbi:MAG: hypothetical protein ABW104_06390 [Candidatus Thiodiazotropha sp. 6PLUC2]